VQVVLGLTEMAQEVVGGSSGTNGTTGKPGDGGLYGGGSGGQYENPQGQSFGGDGAVRIVYVAGARAGAAFPSTNVGA
jgi:hypothetical protein